MQIVNPPALARPVGYAHGLAASGARWLFLAGQSGLDTAGNVVAPGDIVAQFEQALANLETVVKAAGGAVTDIVKLTIYVTDLAAYRAQRQAVGEAYRDRFGRYYPAMTLVEVKSLFDEAALIEIDAIAVLS